MAIKGLRKKITCVVVVPCILGLLLSWASSTVYIYYTYPNQMDNYTNKMLTLQKQTLLQESSILGQCLSLSYLQIILNLVNIGSDFIESYLFYGMLINDELASEKIYQNYNEYKKNEKHDPMISVWYYQNQNSTSDLNKNVNESLEYSSFYNPLLKSVSTATNIQKNSYNLAYLSYNNGLEYSNPGEKADYSEYNTCSNQTNNTCECNSSVKTPYYDPRCRSFYILVNKTKSSDAILTDPYFFADGKWGISACRGLWNYTTSDLLLAYCVDMLISNVFAGDMQKLAMIGSIYNYVLGASGVLLTYKDYPDKEVQNKSITQLEFGDDSKRDRKETQYFKSHILPLFTNQTSKVAYYEKKGDKVMIAVSPIMMKMSSDGNYAHVASVGVAMKKSHIDSKFESLKASFNDILSISILIQIIVLFLILVFCIFVTHKLTGQVIHPIDHLLTILKRLKAGDLAVDIINSYQASPPEVACLYEVFDKLRVVLRFSQIDKENITEATLIYSQALNLFVKFQNERASEICYRELGYICYKKKMWEDSGNYLYEALKLAVKLEIYDEYDIARIKTDAATAFVKTGEKRAEGLKILQEAIETFTKGRHFTDIVVAMIEIAESYERPQELDFNFLEFIDHNLKKVDNSEKNLLYQKFLYVKAVYYKSIGRYKTAALLLQKVLEDYSEFLPEIWVKSADLLIEILSAVKIDPRGILQVKQQRKTLKKDLIVIVSDSLLPSSISWGLTKLLNSVIEPLDRIALLQFADVPLVVYTLSKMPVRLFSLEKKLNKSSNAVLYDSVLEGLKQLRINHFSLKEERKTWIIILTDTADKGSKSGVEEVLIRLKEENVGVIVIKFLFKGEIFEGLSGENVNSFVIWSEDNANVVFKEIEAFLCPYKEVFF